MSINPLSTKMSAINDLQNLAGKIEELKDKLTDEEYKDLLELSHKYYDQEKQKEEKKKPRRFVEYIEIKPVCYYATRDGSNDPEEDCIGEFEGENHFYADPSTDFHLHCSVELKQEKKLKEVKEGFQHLLGDMEMPEGMYDLLKGEGQIITGQSVFIYVSTRITN